MNECVQYVPAAKADLNVRLFRLLVALVLLGLVSHIVFLFQRLG